MDFIEKLIQKKEMTRTQVNNYRAQYQREFENLSINNAQMKRHTDLRNQELSELDKNRNAYLSNLISTNFQELNVQTAEGKVEEPVYKYRKLSLKEKWDRYLEWDSHSGRAVDEDGNVEVYHNYDMDAVNLYFDLRDVNEGAQNAFEACCINCGLDRKQVRDDTVGQLLVHSCRGHWKKDDTFKPATAEDAEKLKADEKRLKALYLGTEAEQFDEFKTMSDEILAIQFESKMINESYIVSHASETMEIYRKLLGYSNLAEKKPDWLWNLDTDKRNLIIGRMNFFKKQQVYIRAVFSKHANRMWGELDYAYELIGKDKRDREADKAAKEVQAALVTMRSAEALLYSKKGTGRVKDEADLYLARVASGNKYVDIAGCKIKKSIDELRARQERELSNDAIMDAITKGMDTGVIRAYLKDYAYDRFGNLDTQEDAEIRRTNHQFIRSYLYDRDYRYLFVENLVNELMDSKIDFSKLSEEEVVQNPKYYISVVDQFSALEGLMKDPNNAEYFDNMTLEKKQQLERVVLPKTAYIYTYVRAVFRKHGYNLDTGNYLSELDSELTMDMSEMEMRGAIAGLEDLNYEVGRINTENYLITQEVHKSRADELKLKHLQITMMENEPLHPENEELVEYVMGGYVSAMQAQTIGSAASARKAMLYVSSRPEGLLFNELISKSVPDAFIYSLMDKKSTDECIVAIARLIEENGNLRDLLDRAKDAFGADIEDDVKMQLVFRGFVENVITKRIYSVAHEKAHQEFLLLSSDSKYYGTDKYELANIAREKMDMDTYVKRIKSLKEAVKPI